MTARLVTRIPRVIEANDSTFVCVFGALSSSSLNERHVEGLESTDAHHIGVRRTPRPTLFSDNIENVVMRRSKAVDDPVAAAKSVYDTIHSSLETAATTLKDCVDRLQSAAPPEEAAPVRVPGLGVHRPTSSGSEMHSSVAFRHALRDLVNLREQLPGEEFATALHAAAVLRDRVGAEVARAKDAEAHDKQTERQRIMDLDERLRVADSQCDLLRNAVARRDSLLAQQRSAYYRDLLCLKGSDGGGPAPAKTYEDMLEKARSQPVSERSSFFDAMVFEALHLSIDMSAADKQAAALRQVRREPRGCQNPHGTLMAP